MTEITSGNIFIDIGVIILVATLIAFIAKIFRQPLIPSFILTGILIGPYGLALITDMQNIRLLSEIGVALLLFVVGIELSLKKLRNISFIATFGATTRSLIIATIGFIVVAFFGFTNMESAYLAVVLAFSSTTIVVKLLSDRQELETLHGRIMIGILLMEDLLAIVALSIFSAVGSPNVVSIFLSIFKVLAMFMLALLASKLLIPKIFGFAAKSQEFLFLSAMALLFFFSLLSYSFGLSIAIGAFIAGITLANLPYNFEIIGRVKPLRDFFSTIFFVTLGTELTISALGPIIWPIIILLMLILLIKPLITMFICSFFEYTKRTSFLASLNMAQISEFGLIIGAQGLALGHISHDIFNFIIVLSIVTIGLTPYFNKYDRQLYKLFSNHLGFFTIFGNGIKELEYKPKKVSYEIILIGYDRIGYAILRTLKELRKKVFVVDFNPDVIRKLIDVKIPCIYGDIGDQEILDHLDYEKTRLIISTIPTVDANKTLMKTVKEKNKNIVIFVTATDIDDALELYDYGADYVILPHFLGGDRVSLMLEDVTSNFRKFIETKIKHINELKRRKMLGHRHPIKLSS